MLSKKILGQISLSSFSPPDSCIEIAQAQLHHNRNSLSFPKKTDIHNNDKKAQKNISLSIVPAAFKYEELVRGETI